MGTLKIRELDSARDMPALRARAVELQDFEREIDSRMPAGEKIADAYVERTNNAAAKSLYLSKGFGEIYISLEKRLQK